MLFRSKSPSKARDFVNKASGRKEGVQRVRSCYNFQDKYHFVAECLFENQEHHGGKLVRKDKSKPPGPTVGLLSEDSEPEEGRSSC